MANRFAIVGAGVSGLTCGVLLAEGGHGVTIFADETGIQTTSAAAGAIWFPYDCEPRARVIAWAIATYRALAGLAREPGTGVSMIELRQFSRAGKAPIPDWVESLGMSVRPITSAEASGYNMAGGFVIAVPLTDTTIYLDYLMRRFRKAGGEVFVPGHLACLEEVDATCGLIVNCAGFGAKRLLSDDNLEPHRGQVALVPKISRLPWAVVCEDPPLMYAIPRANDCVFGGTNELSDARQIEPGTTARIVAECCHVLKIDPPPIQAERVGIRPFRKSGVRLERGMLRDGRPVVHNYGHGGSGFTLSWGCAREATALACDRPGPFSFPS